MQIDEIERLIRRDPARRGLIASEESLEPLCPGHLALAAEELAKRSQHVVIVTGFYIPGATPPAAETDGPPGAALLAAALQRAGTSTQIVTDEPCANAVRVAAQAMNLPKSTTVVLNDEHQIIKWFHTRNPQEDLPQWTHLIAIERAGPSHTLESIENQYKEHANPVMQRKFASAVMPEDRGRHFNMRGRCLDDHTAPLHLLFQLAQAAGIKTIGIGDGGNEIGMGSIAWHELRRRLSGSHGAKIACRIATDWTIVSGVSNWGGMALGAAVLGLRGLSHHLSPWTSHHQLQLLKDLVKDGPAVDGVTGLREPTVDGLPYLTYIQPWEGIRRLAGL